MRCSYADRFSSSYYHPGTNKFQLGAQAFAPGGERYRRLLVRGPGLGLSLPGQIRAAWEWCRDAAGAAAGDGSLLGGDVHVLAEGRVHVQHLITKLIEDHRHSGLVVRFGLLPLRDMRRVSFFNTDRFSLQWVGSWLGNGSELTNFVWDVHTARCVGVPPPSLAPYVGRRIRCAGPVSCASWTRLASSWIAPRYR